MCPGGKDSAMKLSNVVGLRGLRKWKPGESNRAKGIGRERADGRWVSPFGDRLNRRFALRNLAEMKVRRMRRALAVAE